jgi:SAM-dependent methyltransferase
VPCADGNRPRAALRGALSFRPVSDLPLPLGGDSASRLLLALDRERKIHRALNDLGPLAGRDVLVVGGGTEELARYAADGARVTSIGADLGGGQWPVADASADAIVSVWAAFRRIDAVTLAEVDRVLRPGGRLLVVHDYGRDDVSRLRGDLPEYGAWSRRDGPFLASGFRVRVIHCFWTFDGIDEARRFLESTFGDEGRALGAGLKRPRLSYNVAVYHRTRGDARAVSGAEDGATVDAADGPGVGALRPTLGFL